MIIFKNKKLIIPVGLGPNFQEGYEKIHNQNKTVDSSTVSQIVYPDSGFTGLGRVTVNPYELDAKTVDSSTEMQVVTSDKDGLYHVVVNPYHLDAVTIDSSTEYQTITGAYDEITVNPYTLDEKTVNSSTNTQEITSDVDGLSKVVINPYTLDEKTVDSSTNPQVITSDEDGLRQVTIRPYALSPLEVDSSTAAQTIEGAFNEVTVHPYVLDSSNAVITENGDYAFESSADGLSRVDVSVNIDTQSYYDEGYSAGEGAGISEGIAQQKAKLDKTTFTENGTYTREDGWNEVTVDVPIVTINNQDKTVDPSTNTQIITFDSGYTGIGQLTLNPYTLDEKTVDSSTNPQVITSDADGLSKVTINPYVLSPLEVDSSTARQEISGQYGTVTVNPYTLDEKTVDSSTNPQVITSDADGLSKVTINPYVLSPLEVDSSTSIQEITGQFGTVTINPYTLQYKAQELEPSFRNEDVRGAVVKVEPDEGYDGLSAFQYRLPSILTSKTFDASTGNQTYVTNTANTYVKGINEIVINGLDIDSCYTLAASI